MPERGYGEAALDRDCRISNGWRRRAVAHEAVVEHFLPAPAVLPMQLFTLFTADERAVEHVVARPAADRTDPQAHRAQRRMGAAPVVESATRRRAGAARRACRSRESGAAYLARKREQLDLRAVTAEAGADAGEQMYKVVSREATAARRRTATEQAAPGSRLLLDAAFLVPARRAAAFRAAVRPPCADARRRRPRGVAHRSVARV